MRVLFINSWYPNRILKQNGDFIQRHAEAVAKTHQVTAIHVKTDPELKQKIELSEDEINGVKTLIAYVKKTNNPLFKIIRFFKAYMVLIKKAEVFDVVHVNVFFPAGIIAYFMKKKKNIPYIITEHHTIYHKPYNRQIGFLQKILSKIIVKNASFVAPVSDNLGLAMRQFGLKGNYTKVPNVVDVNRFTVSKKEKSVFTILHVSSMSKVKNIEGILQTIKQLEEKIPQFKFQMIGGNAAHFLSKAKDLDLNLNQLEFKNQVSHHEITHYIQQAGVFILFSDVENLPCVILEAFSCGTPVISTNVGGISEYFPNNFGILIPKKDNKALLDAILQIYHQGFKVAKSDAMHQYVVQNFSEEKINSDFTDLYLQATKKLKDEQI